MISKKKKRILPHWNWSGLYVQQNPFLDFMFYWEKQILDSKVENRIPQLKTHKGK